MGVFDAFRRDADDIAMTRRALDEANDPDAGNTDAVTKLIQSILHIGIDGRGPIPSAADAADRKLAKADGNREAAINKVARDGMLGGGVGGAITSLGGFVTMPIALPANVLEFYLQAARMVAEIAHLRGYDLTDPRIRTAILLVLVGSDSQDVLKKAGVAVGGGAIANVALQRLPRAALMVINKAIAFRLLRSVGAKSLTKLGRGVPLVGGAVGGTVDGWMMSRIANGAKREFPARQ